MKLRKTDQRFKLYRYGFDCYLEFDSHDWNNYNRHVRYCNATLGLEFWEFAGRVYENGHWNFGHWKGNSHYRSKRWNSKRIYFRGEEFYTMLLIAMPLADKNSFYL
jgi:hypothetical protein